MLVIPIFVSKIIQENYMKKFILYFFVSISLYAEHDKPPENSKKPVPEAVVVPAVVDSQQIKKNKSVAFYIKYFMILNASNN